VGLMASMASEYILRSRFRVMLGMGECRDPCKGLAVATEAGKC
jgi:hypothetical protein